MNLCLVPDHLKIHGNEKLLRVPARLVQEYDVSSGKTRCKHGLGRLSRRLKRANSGSLKFNVRVVDSDVGVELNADNTDRARGERLSLKCGLGRAKSGGCANNSFK